MNQERYIKTGEFAKLVGVTKHTLFYYDTVSYTHLRAHET